MADITDTAASKINSGVESVKKASQSAITKAQEHLSNAGNWIMNIPSSDGVPQQIIQGLLAVIILAVVIETAIYLYKKYKAYSNSNPMLIDGTKVANRSTIIRQDPSLQNSITLARSKNQKEGIEFTYIFWIYINSWNNDMKWKHVFHKGSQQAEPLKCPAVFLHPVKNSMRVYMNTLSTVEEYIDIDNIPIQKWLCCAISVKQKKLDVYVNGNILKSKNLTSVPKQNYGDVYVTMDGGFDGYISNLQYYANYISYSQLRSHLIEGPAPIPLNEADTFPPYLDSRYWVRAQ